jgi:uracil-DNA glycosylase family protein
MPETTDTYPPAPVPDDPTPERLRAALQHCRACDLWEHATQAVVGEGPERARVMLVGEQPGDREDLAGRPFVGPAGHVLDQGLRRAGLPRDEVFVTNVVKHFRYKQRGKRRIHQNPERWQVSACLPWLTAELERVQPVVLVCLGATAAQALLGSQIRIGRDRGQAADSELAEFVTLTAHPSSILRAREAAAREQAMDAFVADLANVNAWLERG